MTREQHKAKYGIIISMSKQKIYVIYMFTFWNKLIYSKSFCLLSEEELIIRSYTLSLWMYVSLHSP